MAYSRSHVYSTDSSVSLLPGNLCLLEKDEGEEIKFAVIHKHLAIVGQLGSETFTQLCHGKLGDKDPTSYLTQVKWCKLDSQEVIVLTSYKGIKMYNHDGSKSVYSNKFETPPGSLSNRFAKGIASAGNSIYIGTSEGTILVFRVLDKDGSTQVTLVGQLRGHKVAVSDMLITQPPNKACHLLSADETGTVCVWLDMMPGAKPAVTVRESSGMPCFCLTAWQSFVIAGFANGIVRFFDIQSGTKTLEMSVHARPITAMDVAADAGLLLTVSEDSLISVWTLPVSNAEKSLLHMEVMEDRLLCGAKFTDSRGNEFAVTGYDSSNIWTFTKLATSV